MSTFLSVQCTGRFDMLKWPEGWTQAIVLYDGDHQNTPYLAYLYPIRGWVDIVCSFYAIFGAASTIPIGARGIGNVKG